MSIQNINGHIYTTENSCSIQTKAENSQITPKSTRATIAVYTLNLVYTQIDSNIWNPH